VLANLIAAKCAVHGLIALKQTSTTEAFQASLNKLGAEGWEAISGTYAIGKTKKVVLGQGMTPSLAVGTPTWVAVMKRAIKPAGTD
jgi:hypothetical protein